jgi:hypothetical protein
MSEKVKAASTIGIIAICQILAILGISLHVRYHGLFWIDLVLLLGLAFEGAVLFRLSRKLRASKNLSASNR